AKFRPWRLVAYFAFADSDRASEFERYLKSGSGRAFIKKRIS
ncbi:MAG TPA: GIY-YIG nuclease family protein, partial [Pseudolabrys sp.]|nr:GIY-YIG nuclease family protein [Pseudolabrys sp.]